MHFFLHFQRALFLQFNCTLYISNYNFGFRPNRRAQQAIIKLLEYLNDGYTYIVDIDLEKFFDNVPQDKLMTLVGKIVNDPDTESLISKYLKAGVMVKEVRSHQQRNATGRKPIANS